MYALRMKLGAVLLFLTLVAGAMVLLAMPRPGLAQSQTQQVTMSRSVAVNGRGEIRARPDQATISIGVETQGNAADAAMDDNNTRMTALLKTLKEAGIADKDVQTTTFSIYPVYAESRSANEPARVSGYRVSNQVMVTVRALDGLGPLLDRVVRSGANQINGISFGFSDPQALMDQARSAAMADAKRKADQLAKLGQAQLGQVLTISEGAVNPPMPVMLERAMAASDMAAVPMAAGESTVTVEVQVAYGLR